MPGALKRTIGQGIGHILFGGASASDIAPHTFPIGLGTFAYPIDYDYADQFNFTPIETLRQQQDSRDNPGEHSLNPAGLWRRGFDSWHLGAGQETADRKSSSEFRFDNSQGMYIWDKWHLGLLHDTDQKRSTAQTNLRMAVAGSRLYLTDGANVAWTTNVDVDTPTFTNLTGTPPGTNPTSIASDGFNIWTTHVSAGIWKRTNIDNAWAGAAHITGTASLVGFVRGRVLAAQGPSVWDITVAAQGAGGVALGGAGAPLLFTAPNVGFTFTCFAEGRNAIYLGGYAGDKSLIYKATIKSDGTGLDVPTVAAEFDGEQIESLYGYLGPFMFIGTGLQPGWRFALVNQNGDMQVGARVSTTLPVRAFEGQNNFVWFGWSNYSGTSTGMGRLNVQEFGDPNQLVPAYASDLMCTAQGEVQSIVTFQGLQVYTVSGVGVFTTHHNRNLVPSGTLDSGEVLFDMNEDKIGMYLDVVQEGEGGTHGFYFSADGGNFNFLGEHEMHHESFQVGQVVARTFEVRTELKRDAVDPTMAQRLGAVLFRALIVPSVTTEWTIPIFVAPTIKDLYGNEQPLDTLAAFDDIQKLHKGKAVTQLNIFNRAYPVVVTNFRWRIHQLYLDGLNGTCIVTVQPMTEEI